MRRDWPITAASLATALQLRATMTTMTLLVVADGGCVVPRPLHTLRLLPCADEICTVGDDGISGCGEGLAGRRPYWHVAVRQFSRSRAEAQADLVRAMLLLRSADAVAPASLLAAVEDALVVLREVLRCAPVAVRRSADDSGDLCALDCATLSPGVFVLVDIVYARFGTIGRGDGPAGGGDDGIGAEGLLKLGTAMKGNAPLSRADLRWVQHSFDCTAGGGLSRRGLAGLIVWLSMDNGPRALAALRAVEDSLTDGERARVQATFDAQVCDLGLLGEAVLPSVLMAAVAQIAPSPAVEHVTTPPLVGEAPASAAAAAAAALVVHAQSPVLRATASSATASPGSSSTPRARFSSLYLSESYVVAADSSPRAKLLDDAALSETTIGDDVPDPRARIEDVPTSRFIDFVCLLSGVAVDDAFDLEFVGRPEDVVLKPVRSGAR